MFVLGEHTEQEAKEVEGFLTPFFFLQVAQSNRPSKVCVFAFSVQVRCRSSVLHPNERSNS